MDNLDGIGLEKISGLRVASQLLPHGIRLRDDGARLDRCNAQRGQAAEAIEDSGLAIAGKQRRTTNTAEHVVEDWIDLDHLDLEKERMRL